MNSYTWTRTDGLAAWSHLFELVEQHPGSTVVAATEYGRYNSIIRGEAHVMENVLGVDCLLVGATLIGTAGSPTKDIISARVEIPVAEIPREPGASLVDVRLKDGTFWETGRVCFAGLTVELYSRNGEHRRVSEGEIAAWTPGKVVAAGSPVAVA